MRRFILEWGAGPGLWRGLPGQDGRGGHGGRVDRHGGRERLLSNAVAAVAA